MESRGEVCVRSDRDGVVVAEINSDGQIDKDIPGPQDGCQAGPDGTVERSSQRGQPIRAWFDAKDYDLGGGVEQGRLQQPDRVQRDKGVKRSLPSPRPAR